MKYVKAYAVLPDRLISEIQQYIQGQYLYIPAEQSNRKTWGESTGSRKYIYERNEEIKSKYNEGCSMKDLAEKYALSIDSIKKIIYKK